MVAVQEWDHFLEDRKVVAVDMTKRKPISGIGHVQQWIEEIGVVPYLHYIQAFNMGGAGWRVGGTKTASSSLRIGFTADDLLLDISVNKDTVPFWARQISCWCLKNIELL